MSDNQAVYCVDTNLLVEFISLDAIPWRALKPEVDYVRIIVPTKVGEEMDAHKKKSGRLRRRAIEFGQLSRRVEESPSGVVTLRGADPKITLEFGPLFRKSDLDGDQFELDDDDNRIVAEVAAIAGSIPSITLLADDSKPIRLARQAGIPCIRPLAEWRRQEARDERDVEIEELKREIGAKPELALSLGDYQDAGSTQVLRPAPNAIDPACSRAFRDAVLEANPKVSREKLIEKHGYYGGGRFAMPHLPFGGQGLTEDQLQRYTDKYDDYAQKVLTLSEKLARCFDYFGVALPLSIDAGNSGDRAADRVQVTAELEGGFHFLPTRTVAEMIDALLDPPDPPKDNMYDLAGLAARRFDAFERPIRRPDVFYIQDEPETDPETKYVSWRCEELRQAESHCLNVLIAGASDSAAGLLTVTMSSATLAKPTVLRIPLASGPALQTADRSFFLRRLTHIPREYREAFRMKLGV